MNVLLPKLLCLSLVAFTVACGRDPLQAGAHKGIRTIATSHTGPNSYHLQWIDLTDSPHAVLDKIEAGLGSNPGTKELLSSFYDLLGQVVPDQPTAQLRLAMHELLVRRGTEGTKRVFEIATELEKNFKGHPDQLYLSGYLRWVVIRAGNQINASALGQRARDDLRASWEKLLIEKPDYRGPQGVDAKWLNEQLRVLN